MILKEFKFYLSQLTIFLNAIFMEFRLRIHSKHSNHHAIKMSLSLSPKSIPYIFKIPWFVRNVSTRYNAIFYKLPFTENFTKIIFQFTPKGEIAAQIYRLFDQNKPFPLGVCGYSINSGMFGSGRVLVVPRKIGYPSRLRIF